MTLYCSLCIIEATLDASQGVGDSNLATTLMDGNALCVIHAYRYTQKKIEQQKQQRAQIDALINAVDSD